ncbi:MAG: 30S ribosomal protein S18 [Thermoleophilia bacterium]
MANPKKQQRRARPAVGSRRRKYCFFCKEGVEMVDYKDFTTLRRFMSERGKIRSRRTTGACRRHQRQVALAIKRAREVALLPYSSR